MNHTPENKNNRIPPLDIIDLDEKEDLDDTEKTLKVNSKKQDDKSKSFLDKYVFRINWHIVLLLVFLLCAGLIIYRFSNWGTRTKSDFDPNNMDTEIEVETHDNILPLIVDEDTAPPDDGVRTVVVFGNGPFADDRESDDNLAALIEDLSGAVVYNCSVADSYLAASEPNFDSKKDPMDAFNFYWLTTLATVDNTILGEGAFGVLGDDAPADAREAYETLKTLDFNTVDVVAIMYDASDYLDGRYIYNPDNLTDIQSFYGNLSAGIDLIQQTYPHIRIIVMSPTYAYAVNEEGEYVSSDLYLYAEHPLSRYSMMLEQAAAYYVVSFVDNFYGTINELNADEYLEDNLHLNLAGRKKVAERFVNALEYYDE